MDVVGSEIGQKMRSAIKAKLTELGCYVDDELPDYVMVMVANKRTRAQMNDDLSLFLGTNTQMFVNWLHQVLKKLQEVTVNTALNQPENETVKPTKTKSSSKEKKQKSKEKKLKKATKEKHKKKDESGKKYKKVSKKDKKEKKEKKSKDKKKKTKPDDVRRLNVPPLLMNLEKDSEPSITDVFAGQILKNHGYSLEKNKKEDIMIVEDVKPLRKSLKRNRFPIIDPATVTNVTDLPTVEATNNNITSESNEMVTENVIPATDLTSGEPIQIAAQKAMAELEKMPREEQIREMNEIEAKIQGLKRKLADQMETLSEDEDFLNIRTEAEELMNDFAEDVLQEISSTQQQVSVSTPPVPPPSPPPPPPDPTPAPVPQLPHIELNLPKRPLRERLGVRQETWLDRKKDVDSSASDRQIAADEECTREKEKNREREKITFNERVREREREWERGREQAARVGERRRHVALPDRDRDDDDDGWFKSSSGRPGPASVVRVRPRPRPVPAPAPALLMRAVADAHKSLLNVAPKPDKETQVKRALVLPMRRTVDTSNIVIQVQTDRATSDVNIGTGAESQEGSDCEIDLDTESLTDLAESTDNYKSVEYVPEPLRRDCVNIGQNTKNSHTSDSSTFEDDVIKIHNTNKDQERGPQFVVTLDGLDPNIFLAKKLKTEGLSDEIELRPKKLNKGTAEKNNDNKPNEDRANEIDNTSKEVIKTNVEVTETNLEVIKPDIEVTKSNTTVTRTNTQINKSMDKDKQRSLKRNLEKLKDNANENISSMEKKRRASPIFFNMKEKEQEKLKENEKNEKETEIKRERKESGDSDITVTTTPGSRKYDALPSLPAATPPAPRDARPLCRAFPACRFGSACLFRHPRCKLAAACTRPHCIYSHPPPLASHVVPVGSYKSITAPVSSTPPLCRFYPSCANPSCTFLHPKPCRYGAGCINRAQCNFFHHDSPSLKWKSANA